MIDAIGPVQPTPFSSSAQPAPMSEPTSRKTRRSISEAKRILAQNRITGAKAMRIITMLTQAEQSLDSGASVDAQRMAREALKLANESAPALGPDSPPNNQESVGLSGPGEEEDPDSTAASQAQGIDPDAPFERETTSYADGSDDSGVSFQFAQPLTPAQAPFAVRLHELSHIRRETSDAILKGQKVLTSITIRSRIDHATGQRKVGGGQARVIVFPDIKPKLPTGKRINLKA